MFCVRDVAKRRTLVFNPISGRVIWVGEGSRSDADTPLQVKRVTRLEVGELKRCGQRFKQNGEGGPLHLLRHYCLDGLALLRQRACPDVNIEVALVDGIKKGKTVDMVPVHVRQKNMQASLRLLHEPLSKATDTGSGIKNNGLIAALHRNTARVAAITDMGQTGAWETAADSPKRHFQPPLPQEIF